MLLPLKQAPHILRCNWGVNHIGTTRFCLDDCWSLLYFNYPLELRLNGQVHQLQKNSIMLAEPSAEKIYTCREAGRHQFIHFQLAAHKTGRIECPEIIHADQITKSYAPIFNLCIDACLQRRSDAAQAHLWHLLHRIAECKGSYPADSHIHPTALRAAQFLEKQMSEAPSLTEIAAAADVSPNYLNILFKQHYGQTVHAYLLQLRMDHVQHLLLSSDLAIREIADNVGISDLQAFNKLVRRYFGKGPRAIRNTT